MEELFELLIEPFTSPALLEVRGSVRKAPHENQQRAVFAAWSDALAGHQCRSQE